VLGVTAVAVGLSTEWFRTDPRGGEYYTLLLLSALGAIVLAFLLAFLALFLAVLVLALPAARDMREFGIKLIPPHVIVGGLCIVGVSRRARFVSSVSLAEETGRIG
jgi:hypothetical protein